MISLPLRAEAGTPGSAAATPATTAAADSPATRDSRSIDGPLVERARKGDRQAFRQLVERYQRKVFSLALGFLRDPDEARDVSQEAFLKVHKHLDSFQGNASFYTWLYRITVNLCIDLRRKAGRGASVEYDEKIAHEDAGTPADDLSPRRLGFDPARALQNAELRKHLNRALGELSESHRTVLLLREVDGLSYKEIADVMGCPEGTVMSRLFHARKQMQDLLREFGGSGSGAKTDKEAAS